MNSLRWSNRYKFDVPQVDAQHRRWFGLTGAFVDLTNTQQADNAVIEAALIDAMDYTKEHFASEEALMRKVRFPASEYKRHCAIHEAFKSHVERMTEQWVKGHYVEAVKIAAFMSEWLTGHVLVTDIKYLGFFLSAQAQHEQRERMHSVVRTR